MADDRHARYNRSEKGRRRAARYEASDKGRARVERYRSTNGGARMRFYQNLRDTAAAHEEALNALREV